MILKKWVENNKTYLLFERNKVRNLYYPSIKELQWKWSKFLVHSPKNLFLTKLQKYTLRIVWIFLSQSPSHYSKNLYEIKWIIYSNCISIMIIKDLSIPIKNNRFNKHNWKSQTHWLFFVFLFHIILLSYNSISLCGCFFTIVSYPIYYCSPLSC